MTERLGRAVEVVAVAEDGSLDSTGEGRVGEEEESVEDLEMAEEVEVAEVDREERVRNEAAIGEERREDGEGGQDREGWGARRKEIGFVEEGARASGVAVEEAGEERAKVGWTTGAG